MSLFSKPWRPDAAAIAALPDRFPIGKAPQIPSPREVEWVATIHRTHALACLREPAEREQLDAFYEATIKEGPDFARIRRNATFAPVEVVLYSPKAASEIMRQAREIEQNTYAARAKGEHGGALGRLALQLLEWFLFTLWPKSGRFGMVPSLEHIATGARMSKASVVKAQKRLEQFGFLSIQRRRKRVTTRLGVKVVQATNAYTLGLARGLGALALAAFSKKTKAPIEKFASSSESGRQSPIRNKHYYPIAPHEEWFPEAEYKPLLT